MKILVTAFGPFDGRVENGSSLALHALKAATPGIHTRILPVDSVIAPARLRQALRRIRPDVIILLGEAAGAKTIRLESTAWNELDFKIPDIAGRQPADRAIYPDSPPFHRATLPPAPTTGVVKEGAALDTGVMVMRTPSPRPEPELGSGKVMLTEPSALVAAAMAAAPLGMAGGCCSA